MSCEVPKAKPVIVKAANEYPVESIVLESRVNEILREARVVSYSSLPLALGDTVTLKVYTYGTVAVTLLPDAYVNKISERGEGRQIEYEYTIWGNEAKLTKYVTLWYPATIQDAISVFNSICGQLNIPFEAYNLSGKTIVVRDSGIQYADQLIDRICRDNTISYYTYGTNKLVFYYGSIGVSSQQFTFSSREYLADLTDVYNRIRVISLYKLLDDNWDPYTESTIGWRAMAASPASYFNPALQWSPIPVSTLPAFKYGSRCIATTISGYVRPPYVPAPVNEYRFYGYVRYSLPTVLYTAKVPSFSNSITALVADVALQVIDTDVSVTIPVAVDIVLSSEDSEAPPDQHAISMSRIVQVPTTSPATITVILDMSEAKKALDAAEETSFPIKYFYLVFTSNRSVPAPSGTIPKLSVRVDKVYFTHLTAHLVRDTVSEALYGVRERKNINVGYSPLAAYTSSDLNMMGSMQLNPYPIITIEDLQAISYSQEPRLGYAYTISGQVYQLVGVEADVRDVFRYKLTFSKSPGEHRRSKLADKLEFLDWSAKTLLDKTFSGQPLYIRTEPAYIKSLEVTDLKADYFTTTYNYVGNLAANTVGSIGTVNSISLIGTIGTINYVGSITAGTANISYLGSLVGLNAGVANIGTITNVGSLSASIASIGTITNVSYLSANIANVSQITGIGYLNVGTFEAGVIRNVNTIEAYNIRAINIGSISQLNAGLASIGTIQSLGRLNATVASIGSATINTIQNVQYMNVSQANISNITGLQALSVNSATIGTISNVNKAYILDGSINVLSTVNAAYIVSGTIYQGTITTLNVRSERADFMYISNATISSATITIGSVDTVIMKNVNATNVDFVSCTIDNLKIDVRAYGTSLDFSYATISSLDIFVERAATLNVTSLGSINVLRVTSATITGCSITAGTIGNVNITSFANIASCTITASTINTLRILTPDIGDAVIVARNLSVSLRETIGKEKWGYFKEAEELMLPSGTTLYTDSTASGGTCIYRASTQPAGTAWYGPYTSINPGDYWALYRLKVVSTLSTSPLIVVDVYSAQAGGVLAARTLRPADMKTVWDTYAIPVSIRGVYTDVELRGVSFTSGITGIYCDYVALVPMSKVSSDLIEAYAVKAQHIAAEAIQSQHITADWIVGKRFRTAGSGARIEFDTISLRGYDSAGTVQFELKASDGKAYCAGGSVILDSGGIKLSGTIPRLLFYVGGSVTGHIASDIAGLMLWGSQTISVSSPVKIISTLNVVDIHPPIDNAGHLGFSDRRFAYLYAVNKSAAFRHPLYTSKHIVFRCVEAPKITVEDWGVAKLQDGRAFVLFSEELAALIGDLEYAVFLQPEEACSGLVVTRKEPYGFEVVEANNGRSNAKFSWHVKAVRVGDEGTGAIEDELPTDPAERERIEKQRQSLEQARHQKILDNIQRYRKAVSAA